MNIESKGFEIVQGLVSDSVIRSIINDVECCAEQVPISGIRNANKKYSTIEALSRDAVILDRAHSILSGTPEVVRVIYFDKTPDKNWSVTWHQDRTVAVDRQIEIEGWGPWSVKAGVNHVQPPVDVLNQMITFRVHLDTADESNGCLKVIPGSHKLGVLESGDVSGVADSRDPFVCAVDAGDVVVMRPHIVHSSSKAVRPGHRRVVHIEYSCYQLPDGLSWVG